MSKIPVKIVSVGGIGRKIFKGSELVIADANSSQPLPMTQADYDAVAGFNPASLPNLAAWFRFNQGITGTAVSQWDDASGNGRHLKQSTGAAQPAKQADGSILFDGSSDFLKCDAFTLNQPYTVYVLFKQVTWTANDRIFDGEATNSSILFQVGTTPSLSLFAGSTVAANTNLAVDTYGAVASVFNGASSAMQVNATTTTTGNAGAGNMGGFTLGAQGGGGGQWGNIQVKEVAIYSVAHDLATRQLVHTYLLAL